MTEIVLLVDAAAADGVPAALAADTAGGTPLRRLLTDAVGLGLTPTAVLTRNGWRDQVVRGLPGADEVTVVSYEGRAGLLASLAAQLDRISGPVVFVHGEVMTNPDALGDVVADSRLGTAVLTGPADGGVLRVLDGRVVAAGSADHRISGGTQMGLGVLRVADGDRTALAAAARELAGLAMVHGWEADVLDLLVLAAVRRGLVVSPVPIGAYVWARPVSTEQVDRSAKRIDALDAHKVRLERVARPDDGFYSTFVVRKLSRRVTGLAVRTGLSPNAITMIALAVALAAAGAFATGEKAGLITGAILLQVSLVIDCVDGEVARYTRSFTALGAWLDLTTDRIKEYGAYAALAIGASRAGDDVWTLAAATLALQVFRNFVDFGFVTTVLARKATLRGELLPLDLVADPDAADQPDAVDQPSDGAAAATGAANLGRGAVALSARTSGSPWLKWAKRMMFLPIGERWLIISVAAAVSGPRAVFWVLIGLGLVSAVYATLGRVLRALADPPSEAAPDPAMATA